jgi:hypothetical protein
MTLGVGAIFLFISHTMQCQPKAAKHMPRCYPSNHHAKDHKDQQYTTMQRTTKTNSARLIPSVCALQHGEFANGAVGERRPEARIHQLHELGPCRPSAVEFHAMKPQLGVIH